MSVQSAQQVRSNTSVHVAVRIRPLLPKEIAGKEKFCIEQQDNSIQFLRSDKTFTFDQVFSIDNSQAELYNSALHPLMDSFLQGFNVTVIAYGQTGSGKTFTMGINSEPTSFTIPLPDSRIEGCHELPINKVDSNQQKLSSFDGLIPRFLDELFNTLQNGDNTKSELHIQVSFIEIYGEEIRDLLQPTLKRKDTDQIHIRESSSQSGKRSKVWVQGIVEIPVTTRQEAIEQLRVGCLTRTTAETCMNEHSSRSHAIYTINVKRKHGHNNKTTIRSKVTFVDLAGSERLKKTQAAGTLMKEGIQINTGLLSLGNVINALAESEKKMQRAHIPYRSSKLTRLLQDALGGNSQTLFLACVSPAFSSEQETLNTLKYADRAKCIENEAIKNVDRQSETYESLKNLNNIFRRELVKLKFLPDEARQGKSFEQLDDMTENLLHQEIVQHYLTDLENGKFVNSCYETPPMCDIQQNEKKLPDIVCRVEEKFSDTSSDVSSSIFLMEEEDQLSESRFSILQLNNLLDIITLTLEKKEVLSEADSTRMHLISNIKRHEILLQRMEIVRNALHTAVEQMTTLLCPLSDCLLEGTIITEKQRQNWVRKKQLERGKGRLNALTLKIKQIEFKRDELRTELQKIDDRTNKELSNIHIKIDDIRRRQYNTNYLQHALDNPLDLLLRVHDIKAKYKIQQLMDLSHTYLENEKLMASFLDKEPEKVGNCVSLFEKHNNTCNSKYPDIYDKIQDELDNILDTEYIEASLARRVRSRTGMIQSVILGSGWVPRKERMSDADFVKVNTAKLQDCEDNILIFAKLLHNFNLSNCNTRASAAIERLISSISSITDAKEVIKRLAQDVYLQKRLALAAGVAMNDDLNGLALEDRPLDVYNSVTDNGIIADAHTNNNNVSIIEQLEEIENQEIVQAAHSVKALLADGVISNIKMEDSSIVQDLETNLLVAVEEEVIRDAQIKVLKSEVATLSDIIQRQQSSLEQMRDQHEISKFISEYQNIAVEVGITPEEMHGKNVQITSKIKEAFASEIEQLRMHKEELIGQMQLLSSDILLMESLLNTKKQPVTSASLSESCIELQKYHFELKQQLEKHYAHRLKTLTAFNELMMELEIASTKDLLYVVFQNCSNEIRVTETDKLFDSVAYKVKNMSNITASFTNVLDSELLTEIYQEEQLLKVIIEEQRLRFVHAEIETDKCCQLLIDLELSMSAGCLLLKYTNTASLVSESFDTESFFLSIVNHGGYLNITTKSMKILQFFRQSLQEIYDGRTKGLEYIYLLSIEVRNLLNTYSNNPFSQSAQALLIEPNLSNTKRTLRMLQDSCDKLDQFYIPLEQSVRAMLANFDSQFVAFGMESLTQRVSFLLGSTTSDENNSEKISILEKYLQGSQKNTPNPLSSSVSHLDIKDPGYTHLHIYFTPEFGDQMKENIHKISDEIIFIQEVVANAKMRFESLQKIMKVFQEITSFKRKLEEFEANAKSKDRLFGNSSRLLEEERFRKMASRRYPNLLAHLRGEVSRWQKGEYDLEILGAEMKNLLIEMMSTDTELMHLDLGICNASSTSSNSSRRGSLTSLSERTRSSSSPAMHEFKKTQTASERFK